MKPLTLIIEEQHLLRQSRERMDIGGAVLSTLFATCAKRNIRIVVSNQLISNLDTEIIGNLACRIVARLTNPKCISVAKESLGLSWPQAEKIPELEQRQIIVQYAGHPKAFLVRVSEFSFPPKPSELFLEKAAQELLSEVTWQEDTLEHGVQLNGGGLSSEPAEPEAINGDALKVFMRIAKVPEPIEDRCEALQMDRAREVRTRRVLEAKGFIIKERQTLGNKKKFYQVSSKGAEWAEPRHIKVKRYKSGPLHEYLLNEIEKKIGLLNPNFKFQRHSEIGREHGLQPDSVLLQPLGLRTIIEICCNNLDYEAKNLTRERRIEGVDLVVVVTPNRRVKNSLERALERCRSAENSDVKQASLVILDAGECLAQTFDWVAVFERP